MNGVQNGGLGEFCKARGMRQLDWAGKAVAWYCLTGPQTKVPGVFRVDAGQACEDLDAKREDWDFYLELVVEELGWRWDAERKLLWITDYFNWVKVSKRELLEGLKSLPETPWAEELKAEPPVELSPALQAAWRQWFFPVPPAESTAQETAVLSITDFSQLTPELIPLVARRYLRRNTPDFIVQEFVAYLRVRAEFQQSPFFPHAPTSEEENAQGEVG